MRIDSVFSIARGARKKFGNNEPLQIVARMTEELGEVAAEVNARERFGGKIEKGQDGSNLAKEIVDLLRATADLIDHYDLEVDIDHQLESSLKKWRADGFVSGHDA